MWGYMERESSPGRKCFAKSISLTTVFQANVSTVGVFSHGFEICWRLKINIVKCPNVKNRDQNRSKIIIIIIITRVENFKVRGFTPLSVCGYVVGWGWGGWRETVMNRRWAAFRGTAGDYLVSQLR